MSKKIIETFFFFGDKNLPVEGDLFLMKFKRKHDCPRILMFKGSSVELTFYGTRKVYLLSA